MEQISCCHQIGKIIDRILLDPEIVVEQIVVNPDNTRYSYFGAERTGHDLPSLYKETSEGGLALEYEE